MLAMLGPAAAQQQKLVPARSEIKFVSRQMGVPVDGRFTRFDAKVAFDPKKPDASHVEIGIDLDSATLGSDEAESQLKTPDWLATGRFPRAVFQSTSVKPNGPGRFDVAGQLTLKGTRRDLTVPVTLSQSGPATLATGTFVIKRLDYKIGAGEWSDTSLVADEVQVSFKLSLTGVPPL